MFYSHKVTRAEAKLGRRCELCKLLLTEGELVNDGFDHFALAICVARLAEEVSFLKDRVEELELEVG